MYDEPLTKFIITDVAKKSNTPTYPWDDLIGLICDEDALAKHEQQWNRKINEDMAIKGPFFLCGLGEENFTDFPEDLIDKYTKLFWKPEIFVRTVRGSVIIPVDASGTRRVK